ncbi:MAG: hybrid sensor histidine kinase/response regulator [Polyangiales bacterium]
MAMVLHIEGDARTREQVGNLLQTAGHRVTGTASGLKGVRLASELQPDLVLVDLNATDLDGYEITLRIRGIESMQDVPIVALRNKDTADTMSVVGADGVIDKPIDPSEFVSTIDRFLGGHRESVPVQDDRLLRRTLKIVERLEEKIVELSDANERLEEAARLRREFLRNVSHELATPMTPVVGYLRLLLNEELGPLTELQRKCLTSIDSSTTRLRNVVDALLDVSSLETGRMHYYSRQYDFSEVAQSAVNKMLERFEQRDIEIATRIPKVPMIAQGDPEKLERAMVHVLDNASKFTPTGGMVAIESTEFGDDGYMFLVADSGPGVKKEHIEKIFEPFYQADGSETRAVGGTGLGLAFARRVTEALGGKTAIECPPTRKVAGHLLPGTLVELCVRQQPPVSQKPSP